MMETSESRDGHSNTPQSAEAGLLKKVHTAVARIERNRCEAKALAFALSLDMREAKTSGLKDCDLTDDQIVRAALDLVQALNGKGNGFTLPRGTPVSVHRPGSVAIAGRIYVARSNIRGLHPVETTPRDAHGPNLESLRLDIYSRASSTSAAKMGLPLPGSVADGGILRQVLELPPLPEAGGVVLQHDVEQIDAARFCSASTLSLERFSNLVVKDMQWLWRKRALIAQRVEEVRKAAIAGVKIAFRGYKITIEPTKICLDARTIGRPNGPTLIVEYLGFDEALRRGKLFHSVAAEDDLGTMGLLKAPLLHWQRRRHLPGADGLIDRTAAAIAHAAPEGQNAVLLRLFRDLETVVTLPTPNGPFYATLFWRDGIIRAEPTMAERLTFWSTNIAAFDLPHMDVSGTVLAKISGQTAINAWSSPQGRCRNEASESSRLFLVNTATGDIWADNNA